MPVQRFAGWLTNASYDLIDRRVRVVLVGVVILLHDRSRSHVGTRASKL